MFLYQKSQLTLTYNLAIIYYAYPKESMEDKLNPELQNPLIQQTVKHTIGSQFPIVGKNQTLKLVGPLKVDDTLLEWDIPLQRELKLSGRSWNVPIVGDFKLVDNKTGQIIDTVKNLKVANVPKMTDRFSMLIDGNEYTTMNQFRLKPGIYTRKKANDEMESQFNLAVGYNFKMEMDPADGVFYLYIANQKFHLYTLLRAFGIGDAEMTRAWGIELLEKNRSKGINEEGKEIPLMMEKLKRVKLPYEKALNELKDYFDKTRIDVETTKLTLGKSFDRVTPETLLFTSSKLLKVLRGEEKEDERDSLLFKELNTVDDLLQKYFEKKSPTIQKNLAFRTDNKSSIKEIISPDTYSKSIKEFFTTGDLSNPSPQTNPVEMLGEWRKTTISGTGGIQSEHAITFKTRDVHPTHLGFLDPLNTPESGRVGVTLPLSQDVEKRGKDIVTPVIYPDGTEKFITPIQFYEMKIGFPDQHIKGKAKGPTVKAIHHGQSVVLKADKIDAYLAHPNSMFAWTTTLIPFLGNNSGNRALVAAKMVTQSVALKHPETPLVKVMTERGEPYDQIIGDYLKPKVPQDISSSSATVEKIDENYITIKDKKGDQFKVGLYNNFPLNQESYLHSKPVVAVGQTVKRGQALADTNFVDDSGQFAPGLNVNVAYMPWHGYNFEDGIVVTDSLAKRFTSSVMLKRSLQVETNGVLDLKKFKAYYPEELTSSNSDKLDEQGVIKEGQVVLPGETLIAYLQASDLTDTERVLKQMNKMLSRPFKNKSLLWDEEHEGHVVHVRKVGNIYNIYVKEDQPLVIGDKLAARYGDKGIVTRIIPDAEAPHTKDGKRVDMMVNIHGVAGRMNMGQLLEAAAGKWSMKTGKPYNVNNFSDKNYLTDIMDKLKEENIPADEILLDGKDGKPFRKPIFWGNKHYLKLMHVVEHKFKSRGLPGSYDANEQPVHGEEGGQSLDPLQMYSYLAHGARENLYEFAAVKGQKNDEYWRALQLGMPPPPPQRNFIFDKMLAHIQATGVNVAKEGNKFKLYPATTKDVLKWSKGAIPDAAHMLRGKDLASIPGGLFDPKLTGGMRGTNWNHIALNEEIPNPMYDKAIMSLLKMTSTQYDKIVNEDEEESGLTGGALIKKKLEALDVDKELTLARAALQKAPPSQVNSINKRVRYLQVLKEHNLKPTDAYMLGAVPVLPAIFRPVYPLASGDLRVSPVNKHYHDVALLNEQIKAIKATGVDDKEFNKTNRVGLYRAVESLLGFTEPQTHTKEKYEGLLATLSGKSPKHGLIQNKAWSKRQDLSARSTITVEPSLGLDEAGIPDSMLKKTFHPFIVREIVRQGITPLKALDEIDKWTPIADHALNNAIKQRPVMLNRAPSLHKHSVQAFRPVRFTGSSIRVNPLVAKGFNFDFDGDTMSLHVPVSEKAVKEAYGMLPSRNLFKAGDKAHMINLDQDYQLGIYYLSLADKDSGKAFSTIQEAEHAIKDKQTSFFLGGKKMTLGQYYLNEVLPDNLQDYGRLMDSKTVKKILEILYKDYPNDFAKVIDAWKELGRDYAVERGSTISITDMVFDRGPRDTILKKYEKQLTPKMDKYEVAALYAKAKKEIEAKQDELAGKNNFYDMLRSGSTSKKGQVTQILSMPGIIEDVHGEPIPHPIKRGWAEGLDTFDYWNQSYGARKGVVDRSINTSESGALNKELLFNTKGLLVVEDDCHTPNGVELPVMSKEVMDRYLATGMPGIAERNDLVDQAVVSKAERKGIKILKVRSPLTCETEAGVCVKCYGLMANGTPPRIGENVGVIDSQALTERSTQLNMQTFHTGGVAGGTSGITKGFPRLEQLLFVPQTIADKAVLATEEGRITAITDNPAGGKDVKIGAKKYYIPRERKLLYSEGAVVKRGDPLTNGVMKPQEISELKNHLSAQEYVADEINNVYENKFARKTFESVLRGTSNNAELLHVPKHVERDWLKGDVVPLTTINKLNREYKKADNELIEYRPIFKSIEVLPLDTKDWLSRVTTNRIVQTIQDAAAQGMSSDVKGVDPMPAYLYGLSFGQNLKPERKQLY